MLATCGIATATRPDVASLRRHVENEIDESNNSGLEKWFANKVFQTVGRYSYDNYYILAKGTFSMSTNKEKDMTIHYLGMFGGWV